MPESQTHLAHTCSDLDLEQVKARYWAALEAGHYGPAWFSARDVPMLLAEIQRLQADLTFASKRMGELLDERTLALTLRLDP